jgi:hypothetical protein
MSFEIYLIFNIVIFTIIISNVIVYSESSSRKYGKRLNKKIQTIAYASRSADKAIEFSSKGKKFCIRLVDAEVPTGLRYSTIPVYTCKDIYINDELVCKVHKLERFFSKGYLAEFSSSRNESEIAELIDVAYKTAKQLDREYWKNCYEKQDTVKSFYKDK